MFFEESRTGSERMGHGLLSTANVLPLALDTKLNKTVKGWLNSDQIEEGKRLAKQFKITSTCFC